MFEGSCVAIVTPFRDGKVDFNTLEKLVEFHVENETSWILVCGTTGESTTLSHEEHQEIIEKTVKFAKGRVKILAGTGSNNTQESIRLTTFAKKVGADAVLLVSPYYNRPTQKGLYLHYKAIADSVDIPVVLYNIQSRTCVNIEPETIAKISSDCKNVVAIKEASGSLEQISRIKYLVPKIELLSGDDALTLPLLSVGGVGAVSVVANIVPKDVSELIRSYLSGNPKRAMEIHYKLFPLIKAIFLETNPIPIKTAMGLLGLCSDELRLPLSPMDEANKEKLRKSLQDYGLLK